MRVFVLEVNNGTVAGILGRYAMAVFTDKMTAALISLVGQEEDPAAVYSAVLANYPLLKSQVVREAKDFVMCKVKACDQLTLSCLGQIRLVTLECCGQAAQLESNLLENEAKHGLSGATIEDMLHDVCAKEVLGGYYEDYLADLMKEVSVLKGVFISHG